MSKIASNNYKDRYVALLDVLGFKRIASTHTHEHLVSVYKELYGTIEHGLSNGRYILSHDGGKECLRPDIQQATVNALLESDSIYIWTDDNSVESFANIVKATRSLLALSLVSEIPLRGAISIGPLPPGLNQRPPQTCDFPQSLIGKALIEAEKEQEWCGCEVSKAAIEFYKSTCNAGESLIDSKDIVFYPIPRKSGDVGGYAVDWVNQHVAGINIQTIQDAFAPPRDRDTKNWDKFKAEEWPRVKIKLCNTLKFMNFVTNHSPGTSPKV